MVFIHNLRIVRDFNYLYEFPTQSRKSFFNNTYSPTCRLQLNWGDRNVSFAGGILFNYWNSHETPGP